MLKQLRVDFKDGRRPVFIEAERYRREDDKYVFDRPDTDEVSFFCVEDVAGITEIPQDDSEKDARPDMFRGSGRVQGHRRRY